VAEIREMGNVTHTLEFFYDEAGRPLQVFFCNGQGYQRVFNYVLNLQGDVIEVRNSTTGAVYARYLYNAWGELLESSGWFAEHNPLRYRGYFWCSSVGLYYLQTRYYCPTIGRFINADEFLSTGRGLLGFNMFAYTDNNPVNRVDRDGRIWTNNNCPFRRPAWQQLPAGFPQPGGGGSAPPPPTPPMKAALPTSAQRAAGVTTVVANGQFMLDFTVPINNALGNVTAALRSGAVGGVHWFYSQMTHDGAWDVKVYDSWNGTIGDGTFPGRYAVIHFRGMSMTPEELGNWTFGYIGTAAGNGLLALIAGSVYAAPLGNWAQIQNEFVDWGFIIQGIRAAEGDIPLHFRR